MNGNMASQLPRPATCRAACAVTTHHESCLHDPEATDIRIECSADTNQWLCGLSRDRRLGVEEEHYT